MFDLDHWREIISALMANPLRTALTAFGVLWGLFFLVLMLGAGDGFRNANLQRFNDSAANSLYVWSNETSLPYRGLPIGRRPVLTNEDLAAIRQGVSEVGVVVPRGQLGGYRGSNRVARGDRTSTFGVRGDEPEVRLLESIRVDRGRFLNRLDVKDRRKVAVIGREVVRQLYAEGEKIIGSTLHVNGVYFKVIGTYLPSADTQDEDAHRQVFIPMSTFQRAFSMGETVGWFALTPTPGVPSARAFEKVEALLKRRHRIHPEDRRAFGHYNTEEDYLQVVGLFRGISTLVWIVGIGTLAAGVIGVSNIMLIIIRERTREIGIRRALGATPLAIVVQTILEALLLTTAAGYIGLIAGMLFIDTIGPLVSGPEAPILDPTVDVGIALKALLILIVAGCLAGLIPAQRAVSIRPVEALRAD